jgi:hypothetical protein
VDLTAELDDLGVTEPVRAVFEGVVALDSVRPVDA